MRTYIFAQSRKSNSKWIKLSIKLSCMRWLWRAYLRPGTSKLVFFLSMFLVAGFLLFQNQESPSVLSPRDDGTSSIRSDDKVYVLLDRNSGESNPDLPPPSIEDDPINVPLSDWLPVSHSNRVVFVYSSYLDLRKGSHNVRVVAIIKKKTRINQCELIIGNQTHIVSAKSKNIRENWNLLYSASYVLCDVPSSLEQVPDSVALVVGGKVDKTSSVPVQIMTNRAYHGNMSVCIKPFHYEFNRAVWLVEFMEFYRLLGANHFIYYNHTVGPDVQKVLEYYEKEGIATILPWSLPVKSQKEIRTEGIFAALNDCNLRSVGRFDFTAHVDVDEFLIPRGYPTLMELMSDLGTHSTYVFQNVFFYLYWENDTVVHDSMFSGDSSSSLGIELFGAESSAPYLLTLYKTRRLSKPHKPGTRSKFIVRPELVNEVGNHNVWEHTAGSKKVINVPPTQGLSHHYRICEFGGFDCLKDKNEIDRSTHRWMTPLMKNVAEKCHMIFQDLQRCPVAPPLGSPW